MIRSTLALGVSALALGFASPAVAQEAPAAPPTMSFGTWGVDTATIDTTIDPGDDFFAFVNGRWVRDNPLAAEFTRFGSFDMLGEKAVADVEKLVADLVASNPAAGTRERRIVDAHLAYSDTAAINAAGLAPARPWLDKIAAARTHAELVPLFAEPGMPSLVAPNVTVDMKDPTNYIVTVGFSAMGLPDRDYYLVDNPRNAEIQAKYRDFVAFTLQQAGYTDAAAMAERVYAFEHKVAELEWARQAMRNRDITYNKLSRDELLALHPAFPMAALLNAAGFGDQASFLVAQLPPTAEESAALRLSEAFLAGIGGGLPAMERLVMDTPLDVLKAFMVSRFFAAHAPVLPQAIDDANFAFYGTFLSGQQEQRPRWKRAITATEAQLGEQLGEAYAARYFPAENKAAMDALVANLRLAMAASIRENSWMSDATRVEAQAKLDAFISQIGYPDKFKAYEGLTIDRAAPLANRIGALAWERDYDRARLGKPVDRTEWPLLPQTVNAGYVPPFNSITFPGGILQPPFFNLTADPAVNYGAIGAVIGHEMGHGFDDQGAKSDGTGLLRDWWAPEDKTRFEALGNQLVEQYSAFCPFEDGEPRCVNGRLTLGENIGDVGGLSLAYRAYRVSLNGKELPVIDGFTGDQRFFLAWAQLWREAQREESARDRLLTDPHSPAEARVNEVVRNQDAWYKAFNVTPDDDLYLPPEKRVHIW